MKHKHAEFLKAIAEGKTIEYKYSNAEESEYSWFDILLCTRLRDGQRLYNTTAMEFLLSGEQHPVFEVDLRIKAES